MIKFRLVRQPEIAYLTEAGRSYGEAGPPRMAWAAPARHLFVSGWEEFDMGLGPQALAERIRSFLVRTEQ